MILQYSAHRSTIRTCMIFFLNPTKFVEVFIVELSSFMKVSFYTLYTLCTHLTFFVHF